MNKRLSNEEINNILEENKNRYDFLKDCPYKGNKCGSVEPPSYCDKCYKKGKYDILNGRSADEFAYVFPEEIGNSSYHKIRDEHNKKLAKECEFLSEKTCKYKDYWEKCVFCDKEFSR